MASRQGTSNGPDWKDVTWAAQEYARDWNGTVTIVLRPAGNQKLPTMSVVASLYADLSASQGARPLASASVSMHASGGMDIAAAALHALYELDKEIYRREIGFSHLER